jgi:hypothetical protein
LWFVRSNLCWNMRFAPSREVMGAGLGAAKERRMAPIFLEATPDRALRFLSSSAVNRRVAGSSPARGAKFFHHFRVYLMSQNKGDLVKLLLHQAEWDSESRARLVLMR